MQGGVARFELFPGEGFQVQGLRVEDAVDGSSTWIGTIDTPEEGSVVLTLGDKGVFGRIDIGLSQYVVQTGADGHTRVTQIDPAAFADPNLYAGDEEPAPAENELTASPATALASSSNTVDVLVLYTSASMSSSNTTDPGTLINNLVADANNSYIASGVNGALRTVGYVQFSSYTEPSTGDPNVYKTDALNMQSGTGAFASVPNLRNLYGADLVALLVDGTKMTGTCGNGPIRDTNAASQSSNFAAVIAATCAIGDRTFTHELGHKMSARHNWKQATELTGYYDPTDNAPYHYNHGYWSSSPAFKDIMAVYPSCNTPPNGGCARINRWSSPTQTYLGAPLGLSGAQPTDMVTTLSQTMPMVAQYVTPAGMVVPGAPTRVHVQSLNCRGQNEVDTTGASGTVGWFEVYTASSTSFSPQTLAYSGPDGAVTINVAGTTYVRARSCNAAGCSAYTNADQTATFTNGCF